MDDLNKAYEPPKSELSVSTRIEAPDEIAMMIKHGWVAACFSAAMTFVVIFLLPDADWWALIDVALILGLAFGIYKKSRAAATCMFVYFLSSKIWAIVATGQFNGIGLGLVFTYFYFRAMVGTYQYHQFVKEQSGAQGATAGPS